MTSAAFSTCDLCDAHRHDPGLRVLPPVFQAYGRRRAFCGEIATVQCHEDNSFVKAALETPGRGRVLVVDGGGSLRRALVGGNLAAAAVRNGWAGIVVDGVVRDRAELDAADVGVRALGLLPWSNERRGEGRADGPVTLQGIVMHPGEWLYADDDGIVVLPSPAREGTRP